jgi:hypothetical protein
LRVALWVARSTINYLRILGIYTYQSDRFDRKLFIAVTHLHLQKLLDLFYGFSNIGELNLKFYRKIMRNGDYGSIAIPKPILDEFLNNGATHVVLEEQNGILIVSPI